MRPSVKRRWVIALGSNLNHRRVMLELGASACYKLHQGEAHRFRVSPIYETPALLPELAPAHWNRPYLNAVLELETSLEPHELLRELKAIELLAGRSDRARWSPRELDLDLISATELSSGERIQIDTPDLQVPHPAWTSRSFVCDPLKDLQPSFSKQARSLSDHSPLWAAIVNATPDSFSDGGLWSPELIESSLDLYEEFSVGIIDLGAESTRPGAHRVTTEEEWFRLSPFIDVFQSRYQDRHLRPLLSIDTRNFETASKALSKGADIINDVSGCEDPKMREVLRDSDCDIIVMHSLSVPADPAKILPEDDDVVLRVGEWFEKKCEELAASGIDLNRVIFDPGIGFGKNALQNLAICRGILRLRDLPARVLAGHSRKSFLKPFSNLPAASLDLESIGVSLALIQQGVDILRVHAPELHIRSFRGFQHCRTGNQL